MSVSSNPVSFGLNPRGLSYDRIVEIAKAAEKAGFDAITFSDRPPENNLEGWTLATAVAMQTSRIAVTHSTLNVPYRYPALLAKMAATLDIVTGGKNRVRLTLGAGSQEEHAVSYGMEWGTPGERVTGMLDTISILRGMWTAEGPFDYEGKRYSVKGAVLNPKPVGAIPVYVGARMPRTLSIAGSMADGWLKNGGWPSSPEEFAELQETVDRSAEKAGRDPGKIRRVVNCTAYVGDKDPATVMPSTFGSAGGLMGTKDQVFDIIDKHRAAGVDTFHVQFNNDIIDEQLPRFGEEIIAKLK